MKLQKFILTIAIAFAFGSLCFSQTSKPMVKHAKLADTKKMYVINRFNNLRDGEIASCPDLSLFSRPYNSPSSATTTEEDANGDNYIVATSFQTIGGNIQTVSIWMVSMSFDFGWQECTGDPMNVNVVFYENNDDEIGNIVHQFNNLSTIIVPANTLLFDDIPIYILTVTLPTPISMNKGFVSVQGTTPSSGTDCWLMWIDAPLSSGVAYQSENGVWNELESAYTLCLGGELPTCPSPMNISLVNSGLNTIALNWEQLGSVSGWNIEYGPQGFTPSGTPNITGISTHPYSISGLNSATYYDFYIQSDCGSIWAGPFTAHTNNCEVENQCAYTFNLIDDYGDGWTGCGFAIYENDLLVDIINLKTGNAGSKVVNFCSNSEVVIKFIEGEFSEDIAFEIVDLWSEQVVNFDVGYFSSSSEGDTVFQFTPDCSVPACPKPTNLIASNITTSSAIISWTENGSASEWIVEYGPLGFTLGQGTTLTPNSTSVVLSNLQVATYYNVYVRSNCSGVGEYSNWSNPLTILTECSITNVLNESFEVNVPPACWLNFANGVGNDVWKITDLLVNSGTKSAVASYESSGGENQKWLVTGQIELLQNNELTFYVRDYFTPNYQSYLKVMISTNDDPNNIAAYTQLLQIAESDISNMYFTKISIDVSEYTGETVYFAFVMVDNDGDEWYLDDVKLELLGNTNIKTPENLPINIYPNPTNDLVTITNVEGAEIEIINVMGKTVARFNPSSNLYVFNTSSLKSGNYIVRISIDKNIVCKNLIICK